MRKHFNFFILTVYLTASFFSLPARAYENDSAEKRSERLKQLVKSTNDLQASNIKSERAKLLADGIFELIKMEKYNEAKRLFDQWEKVDPDDSRLPATRKFLNRIVREKNPNKQEELKAEFAKDLINQSLSAMKEVNASFEKLNRSLKDLGPQNQGEELCEAAAKGDAYQVKTLLDAGVKIGSKDRFGSTALMNAMLKGNKELVKLLIDRGADVNEVGLMGLTPLICASSKGYVDIIRLLIQAGANVNVTTQTGLTALSAAQKKGHSQAVELLKQSGAIQ